MRSPKPFLALVAVLVAAAPRPGAAQVGELFREAPEPKPPPPLDPSVPRGPAYPSRVERPTATRPACSPERPVCVHAVGSADSAMTWLTALETAYERLVLGMGLPAPLGDFEGGSPALDLYLDSEPDSPPLVVGRDDPAVDRDRASAFCRAGIHADPDRTATQCLGEAIAWRLDAATAPHQRRAYATHLWWIVGEPTGRDLEVVDTVQRHPERALLARDLGDGSEGSALFFELMEARLGRAGPGELATALIALGAHEPSPPGWRWHNEPDVMDVARETFGGTPTRRAALFSDLAVARAFVGTRGDGRHVPALGWTGDAGRVRFEWSVPFSSLPRRLAPARPIEPTGSTYLWLDLDDVPKGARLAFVAEWEAPVPFKWTLVTVAADGRELGRVEVPFLERATRVERTLVDLEGARGVLIAGTNLGDLSPTYPFDPDFAPYEPHGYTVYLARL